MKKPRKWVPRFKWCVGDRDSWKEMPKKMRCALEKKMNGMLCDKKGTSEELKTALSNVQSFDEIQEIADNYDFTLDPWDMDGPISEIEFSVVREDNPDGLKNYGGADNDKLVLFDDDEGEIFCNKEDLIRAIDIVETIAKALKDKGL